MTLKMAILGAGFIGKNLLSSCIDRGYEVRVLDRKPCPVEYETKVDWGQGLFENNRDILRVIRGSDVVFHLISSTVPGDEVDENEEIFSNVMQTINLLKLCVKEEVKRLVFISSSSVYGIQEKLPISENYATNPISSHGIHKLTIEKYLQLYKYEYGLDCKIMRLSNPYGIGQDIYGRQGFVSIIIGKMLKGSPVMIRGDGTAVRDFVHMDDVVEACHLLATTNSDEMTFNIGSGKGVCLSDVIREIYKICQRELPVSYTALRKTDIPTSILDISKSASILGYKPKVSLGDGLKRVLAYYGLNPDDALGTHKQTAEQ